MKIRRYDLDVPEELDERFKKAMALEVEKGRLAARVGPRDFLLALVMQGLAMLEVKQKASEPRLVISAQEAADQAAARWNARAR